jgi:tellurite resistance protein TerC
MISLWVGFHIFVIVMLVLDLGVFHRKAHVIRIREAVIWSGVWISLALLFNVLIYFWQGPEVALQFLTGYLIEKSLSVDNIFLFLLLFTYFRVTPDYQHKVLFWGIVGALLLRAIFIAAGVTLISKFHWVIYLFGGFLVLSGIRMATQKEGEIHPEHNPVLRLFRRWMPVTDEYHGDRFFIKREGRRYATPLFVVLLVVETTDLIFAVDSIPAILAITLDPFIVYTSNVFAILGLRALYFALAGMLQLFHYLHYGISAILVFVGLKMLLTDIYKVPVTMALGVIAGILIVSVLASRMYPKKVIDIPPSIDPVIKDPPPG